MRWRDRARPIIRRVLEETKGLTDKDIRAALLKARRDEYERYDYGWAKWPIHVWRDEVRVQRGLKKPKPAPLIEGQMDLFGGDS